MRWQGPPCPFSEAYLSGDPFCNGTWPLFAADSVLLYNLTADPNEHDDLSKALPAVVARLRGLIAGFNGTAVSSAQQCLPDDPRAAPGEGVCASATCGKTGTIFPWE